MVDDDDDDARDDDSGRLIGVRRHSDAGAVVPEAVGLDGSCWEHNVVAAAVLETATTACWRSIQGDDRRLFQPVNTGPHRHEAEEEGAQT